MQEFDVVIVGAGMAGASLAWALAPKRRVLLLEQESQPGYHSTGRSAATLHSSYGNATVRALTAASAPFYREPPPGFAPTALARPLGVLMVARDDQLDLLEQEAEHASAFVPSIERWDAERCLARVPALRREQIAAALYDPTMLDLDVSAIHAGFLRGARAAGAALRTDAALVGAAAVGGGWRLQLRDGEIGCDVLVNASGAWADTVAGRAGLGPLGIVPKRRTAIIVQPPAGQRRRVLANDRRRRRGVVRQAGRRPAPVLARRRDSVRGLRRAARRARRGHLRRSDRDRLRLPDPPDREPLGRPALLRRRQDTGGGLRPAGEWLLTGWPARAATASRPRPRWPCCRRR